ncbi:MAG: sodium/solute symporter [Planctomycetes bacterium]|nr:sodium/solute symporter [Planctomycetota bacterium]
MIFTLAASFAPLDWMVLAVYMAAVIALGIFVGRKKRGGDEFFLAGRSMPMWAVSISVLATSLSAATFIGGPQQAYTSNLTYLSATIGGIIAIFIVAFGFLPAYYKQGVTTVYQLIGNTYGGTSQRCASAMFMLGRIFASGARLFMVAIPFALITFGDIEPNHLIASILIIAIAASLYTMVGGIRAVIWTDVLQAIFLVVAVTAALIVLLNKIPLDFGEILTVLGDTKVGDTNKLTVIDTSTDPSKWYTLWTALIGWTIFNVAAFGTDQDLAQRMLTCKSAKSASWSAILSHLIGWPITALFLFLGLLLFIVYKRPDLMGSAAIVDNIDDTRKIFIEFIIHEMPAGLRGLMLAGLFAAAMSSLDSALNAMASTTITDFYRPLTTINGKQSEKAQQRELGLSRILIFVWALLLAGFACFCVYWQSASKKTLIDFALGVMTFAYSGLLAVFLTALFTKRGNAVSVIAALCTGFICILLMQGFAWKEWAPWFNIDIVKYTISMPWQMLIATSLSFAVCCVGRRSVNTSTT